MAYLRFLASVCLSALASCAVHVGTNRDADPTEARENPEPEAPVATRPTDHTAVERREEERRERERKDNACREELVGLDAAEQRRAQTAQAEAATAAERRALDECPKTKLRPGTYESEPGSPIRLTLQVTEAGCAVYETVASGTSTTTRRIEADRGYYDRDYHRDWYCAARGRVTASQMTDPIQYEGACPPGSTFSQKAAWKAAGARIIVTDPPGLPSVRLQRTAESVQLAGGYPTLWPRERRTSVQGAQVAVVFAAPIAGRTYDGAPGGADPCAALAARRRQEEQAQGDAEFNAAFERSPSDRGSDRSAPPKDSE